MTLSASRNPSNSLALSASPARYVLIAPVRDEAQHLEKTIDAIVAQTVTPVKLVIVNDGSTDATKEIATSAAVRHSWVEVLHRADRGKRNVGPGVIEAFYDGYRSLGNVQYEYLCKMDGDVSFGKQYFEHLLSLFRKHHRLGLASGKVYLPVGAKLVPERMLDEHVAGQVRLYARDCFEEIGGLVAEVMWDVIDEHRARMIGWETRSFRDPALRIIHHRLMGSSQNSIIHGRIRWGRGQYFIGTHPLYMIASGIYRMWERPFMIGGLSILLGYLVAFLRRQPRYNDLVFRRHLRKWQLQRLGF